MTKFFDSFSGEYRELNFHGIKCKREPEPVFPDPVYFEKLHESMPEPVMLPDETRHAKLLKEFEDYQRILSGEPGAALVGYRDEP
jgi:hypothetical protein